jgi:hypothetical protein
MRTNLLSKLGMTLKRFSKVMEVSIWLYVAVEGEKLFVVA